MRAWLATLVACALTSGVADAQTPATGRLEPLWGGHYRPGRLLPVAVEVPAGVAGPVRLTVDGGPSVAPWADREAGARQRRVVSALGHGAGPHLRLRAGDGTLAELQWQRPARNVALVGVLAGPGDAGWVPLGLLDARTRATEAWRGDRPPDRAVWFEVLDLCVVGRLDANAMDAARARALGHWVRGGGQVLLTDPDLLRRAPQLDRELFAPVDPGEELAAAIPGLPPHFAGALRQRGLGVRDLVYDAQRRPHHVRFRCGLGGGALLLSEFHDADARQAFEALLESLAVPHEEQVPTLAPTVVAAFPPAAPSGWARAGLAFWLCVVPVLALLGSRGRAWFTAGSLGATLVALGLALAALGPVAELLPLVTPAGGSRWVVHVAAPRAAECTIETTRAEGVRPLMQRIAEANRPPATWNAADAILSDWHVERGFRGAVEVLGAPAPGGTVQGRLGATTLLVSNETGEDLTACLLAWRGGLLDCGPMLAGEVRQVPIPEALPGPIATLATVAPQAGPDGVRAFRAARARLDARTPTLLALAPTLAVPPPVITGARVRTLPAVLIAPLP